MDQDPAVGTLDDELGNEIELALRVDPSPGLKAHVRTRIATDLTSGAWHLAWRLVGVGALAAAVVLAILVSRGERTAQQPLEVGRLVATPPGESTPPAVPVAEEAPPLTIPERTVVRVNSDSDIRPRLPSVATGPEALISPAEAAALRLLMIQTRDGRVDPSALGDIRDSNEPLEPLNEIAIQAIAIEPLSRLAPLEGERQ
jgi:hypothetical protein